MKKLHLLDSAGIPACKKSKNHSRTFNLSKIDNFDCECCKRAIGKPYFNYEPDFFIESAQRAKLKAVI